MTARPITPENGICECGSDDLHIASDQNGHYVECCDCGKEYAHDGLFPCDPEFDAKGRASRESTSEGSGDG